MCANDRPKPHQTFWTAAFPSLARNTRELRCKATDLAQGRLSQREYDYADSLKRSQLSNMAFYAQSCGEILILAVIVGVMFGLHVDAGTQQNTWGLSVLIALASGIWLLLSVPWFLLEKRRPGMSTGDMNVAVAGLWQLRRAVTKIVRLRQTLFYLIGYFLLGDCLNTSVTVIQTLQNSVAEYSTLSLTYLLLVGIAAQAVGIYGFWWVQRRFRVRTKTMFNWVAVAIAVLDGWGLVGIFTQRFGFHNRWELWLFQVYYGAVLLSWCGGFGVACALTVCRSVRVPLVLVQSDHDIRGYGVSLFPLSIEMHQTKT